MDKQPDDTFTGAVVAEAADLSVLELRVNDLLALGQQTRARQLTEEFLTRLPDSPAVHYLLSRICEAEDRLVPGLAAAEAAVQLAPEWAGAHVRRGAMLYRLGAFAAAEEALRTALTLQPDSSDALLQYAELLALVERPEALALVERVLMLDPELAGAHVLRAELLRRTEPHRWQTSQAVARRAVELDPEDALAHALLGHLLLESGDVAGAEARFRAALALDPCETLAQRGLTRTLIARHPLYRPMLWYTVALQRYGTAGQLTLVIGLWVLVTAVLALLRSWNVSGVIVNLLLAAYIAFCCYTWFAGRVTHWLLRRQYPWFAGVPYV